MHHGCESYKAALVSQASRPGWQLTRRGLLASLGLGAVGLLSTRSALSQVVVNGEGQDHEGDIIVNVFLRGGMDGMSAVVPYGEDAYHRARPNLSLKSPKDASAPSARTLDLDGFFGLNPALAAIYPLFESKQMSIVHAVGSGDQTRSHFEAMNAMERGMFQMRGGLQTGWVARHLAVTPRKTQSPLRAVALGQTMPDSLRGATHAASMFDLADYRLEDPEMLSNLRHMYGSGSDLMTQAGKQTLEVLERLGKIDVAQGMNRYPKTHLGTALHQVAALIRSGVGLEVASLDMGGWDTHVAQGTTVGWLPSYLKELAEALAAFVSDMGTAMKRVSVVVQTEFGRRVEENTGLGTDHGRASCMFLIGGGALGGRVFVDWPGLEKSQLDEVGDLKVTTDYRDVLGDLLSKRVAGSRPEEVFPDWAPKKQGFFAPLS